MVTLRDTIKGLHGSMQVTLRVADDSYLYIGSGDFELQVPRERIKSARTISELRALSNQVRVEYSDFIRIGGKIAIPGSTLKGVVRSRLEMLLKDSCFIRGRGPIRELPRKGTHGWRHVRVWEECVTKEKRSTCDLSRSGLVANVVICPVCDLFGTAGLVSRVYFGNFYMTKGGIERINLEYDEKVVAVTPKSEFVGEIALRGVTIEELGLILIGLRVLDKKPIMVGKHKYRRVKDSQGRELTFGRVLAFVNEMTLSDLSLRYLKESNLGLRDYKRVKGEDLEKLMSTAVKRALQSYKFEFDVDMDNLTVKFDEVERVEQLSKER